MSLPFIHGPALTHLPTVCDAILRADVQELLPWAWEVGDSIREVARRDPAVNSFTEGVGRLLRAAGKKGSVSSCEFAKRELVKGLAHLGDYRWHQAMMAAVIRGKGWVRAVPEDRFIRETAAEAGRRVTLFSKSPIGLMQEIVKGKRKEVRVVPIRLTSAIQMALARQFLGRMVGGVFWAAEFDDLASKLRDRGAVYYPLEFGAEPQNIRLWERLLGNPVLVRLDFDGLRTIFKVCSFGWEGEGLPSLVGRHPEGVSLCRFALKHRFAFYEAIAFCLACPDPLQAASEIRERLDAFRQGQRPVRVFSELGETDKLALYALTLPSLKIGTRGNIPLSYDSFVGNLEVYLFFGGGNVTQISKLFSDFTRLSRRELGSEKDKNVYDYFSLLFRKVRGKKVFYPLLRELHAALAERDQPPPFSALQLLVQSSKAQSKEKLQAQIQAFMALHKARLKFSPFVEREILPSILSRSNPLQAAKEFLDRVRDYRQNAPSNLNWNTMSNPERWALFAVTTEHYRAVFPDHEKKNRSRFLEEFGCFAYLLAPIDDLKRFAEEIVSVQKGIERHIRLADLFRKPIIGKWLKRAEKRARLRRGLLCGSTLHNRTFFKNLNGVFSEDVFEAALELFERGYVLEDSLFMRYASTPDRLVRLEEAESRAVDLARGEPTGSLEDPFEVISMLRLLNDHESPVLGSNGLAEMLGGMRVVLQDRSVRVSPVGVRAVPQSFRVSEVLDKKIILELCQNIVRHFSLTDVVREILADPKEEGRIPRRVWMDLRTQYPALVLGDGVTGGVFDVNDMTARAIAGDILTFMSVRGIWNPKTVKSLLMAYTAQFLLTEAGKGRIQAFHSGLPPGEIVLTLEEIHNFFEIEFEETVRNIRDGLLQGVSSEARRADIQRNLRDKNFVSKERKRLAPLFNAIQGLDLPETTVTLLPSRDRADAFFGHVAGNCLDKEIEYGWFGFTDPTFLPFRILVNGEWRGTIMTFTRRIKGRKALILSGIDSQIPFKPGHFLEQLETAFERLAQKGRYDWVLLTAGPGTISSRRSFLESEALRRYPERLRLDAPIYIVKKGKGRSPDPENYRGFHDEFLVMVDRRRLR